MRRERTGEKEREERRKEILQMLTGNKLIAYSYQQEGKAHFVTHNQIHQRHPPPPPPLCHWLRCTHRGDMHSSATADLGALCVDMKCSQDEDEAGECLQWREQGAVLWTERCVNVTESHKWTTYCERHKREESVCQR